MSEDQPGQKLRNYEQELKEAQEILKKIICYLPKSNSKDICKCPCCNATRYVESL